MSFQTFLDQYNAPALIYRDGFQNKHFENLTPEETDEAIKLLQERAEKRDILSISALGMIKSDKACAVLEKIYGAISIEDSLKVSVSIALFQATKDFKYQDVVINCMTSSVAEVAERASTFITWTIPTPATESALCNLLKSPQTDFRRRLWIAQQCLPWQFGLDRFQVQDLNMDSKEFEKITALLLEPAKLEEGIENLKSMIKRKRFYWNSLAQNP